MNREASSGLTRKILSDPDKKKVDPNDIPDILYFGAPAGNIPVDTKSLEAPIFLTPLKGIASLFTWPRWTNLFIRKHTQGLKWDYPQWYWGDDKLQNPLSLIMGYHNNPELQSHMLNDNQGIIFAVDVSNKKDDIYLSPHNGPNREVFYSGKAPLEVIEVIPVTNNILMKYSDEKFEMQPTLEAWTPTKQTRTVQMTTEQAILNKADDILADLDRLESKLPTYMGAPKLWAEFTQLEDDETSEWLQEHGESLKQESEIVKFIQHGNQLISNLKSSNLSNETIQEMCDAIRCANTCYQQYTGVFVENVDDVMNATRSKVFTLQTTDGKRETLEFPEDQVDTAELFRAVQGLQHVLYKLNIASATVTPDSGTITNFKPFRTPGSKFDGYEIQSHVIPTKWDDDLTEVKEFYVEGHYRGEYGKTESEIALESFTNDDLAQLYMDRAIGGDPTNLNFHGNYGPSYFEDYDKWPVNITQEAEDKTLELVKAIDNDPKADPERVKKLKEQLKDRDQNSPELNEYLQEAEQPYVSEAIVMEDSSAEGVPNLIPTIANTNQTGITFHDEPVKWDWKSDGDNHKIEDVGGDTVYPRGRPRRKYELDDVDLQNVKTFAGSDSDVPDFRNAARYARQYEIDYGVQTNPEDWTHDKAIGQIQVGNQDCPVEIHWYGFEDSDGKQVVVNREIPLDRGRNQTYRNLRRRIQNNIEEGNDSMTTETYTLDESHFTETFVPIQGGAILTTGRVFDVAQKIRKNLLENNGVGVPDIVFEECRDFSESERIFLDNIMVNKNDNLITITGWLEDAKIHCESIPAQINQLINEDANKRFSPMEFKKMTVQEYFTEYQSDMPSEVIEQISGLTKTYNEYQAERKASGFEE